MASDRKLTTSAGDGARTDGSRPDTTAAPEAAAPAEGKASRKLGPLLALRSYLWRYKAMLAAAGVALVVSAMAMLAVPLALRRIIDYGFKGSDGVFIDRYFMMLIVIGVVLAAASAARFFLVNWIGERVVADLRSDIFQHLSRLGPSFFERTHSAEVMSRLTADTTQIKSAAGSAISQLLRNLVMLVGSLVMMLVTSFKLSLVLLVAIPLIVLPLMAYGRVVRKLSRSAQDKLAEASSYAAENLAAVRTMQAYTHEAVVSERFRAAVERSFEAARSRNWARAFLTAVTIFLVFASIAGVLWIGATAVVSGSMSGGRLGQFVVYAAFAAGALAELSEVYGEVQQAAGAAERLGELLAERPAIEAPADPVPLPGSDPGAVAFVGVSFSYPSRPEIAALHNVSLAIRPGEQVAIVGPSGAGKSTLFALLQRFYDCDAGKVTVDGVDVRRTDPLALRRRLAYVPQEVALFADTVVENIRYGAPGASLDDVKRAAEAAQAHEFIVRLPNGYDTRLGERGATLSGGQRQRIAIARAILRDAPVLLLDEATSALDAESETLVQKALERVMSGRTTLVIAHRLATVQKADRIVVMDGGRIVEEGTHASLVARGGLYARLADLQLTGERVA